MTAVDYIGWSMLGCFIGALWVIAVMVVVDPPALFLRFIAPLIAAGMTLALVLMGVNAT